MLFFYPDASDWQRRIRLGDGFSFTESALSGTFAASRVTVDDPAADITIVGHHAFRAVETDCSWETLFRGYFAARRVKRSKEKGFLTGASREWDCDVVDSNAVLQFEVIRGSTAKRPKETDTQRLAWLLGSGYKGPVLDDDTYVLGYDVDLDKADYTGQTMADVLADCGSASGANYFATWDYPKDGYALHYYRPTRSFYSSSLRISNVLSDVDGETTFAPDPGAELELNPEKVFSGVLLQYGEKGSYVFEDSATVLAAIGHRRETNEAQPAVRTAARASAKAERYLEEAETEIPTITCVVHNVPTDKVNLLRIGHRVQVRFSHLPGYESFTWMRVTRRTVAQDGETQQYYSLGLELSDPKQVGNRVRHPARSVDPDVDDGASVSFTRRCFSAAQERDDCQGGLADSFSYGGAPPGNTTVTSTSGHATAGIFVGGGCNSPAVGYSGINTDEQWLEVTGTPTSDAVGIKVSYVVGTIRGVASGGLLAYGVASVAPTDQRGAFEVLGYCDADGDDSFVVPLSLVGTGGFIVIGPGWQCANAGNACSSEVGNPTDSGAANSGQVALTSISMVEVTADAVGTTTVWRPMTGDIDGSNKTYSLPGWNGKGTPRLRIGPVEYALGTDYTVDRDAGTATLRFAPWVGADLNGRWDT